jgi:hypothetical protein
MIADGTHMITPPSRWSASAVSAVTRGAAS